MKIEELCRKVVEARLKAGYSECTVWSRYAEYYSPLISFYRNYGEEDFSVEMMVRYREHSLARMERGEISEHRHHAIMRGVKQLIEFHETGKLHWTTQAKESKFPINEYYQGLLEPV